jgi:hypothetical protein
VKSHIRISRVEGATAGVAGAWGIIPDVLALAWLQSRMVFHVGASFGFDPHHPMRPAELLTLTGVYETAEDARAALDGVGRHIAIAYGEGKLRGDEKRTLQGRLIRMVGGHFTKKMFGKFIPFVASPIMAVQNGDAVAELGHRAIRFYGG